MLFEGIFLLCAVHVLTKGYKTVVEVIKNNFRLCSKSSAVCFHIVINFLPEYIKTWTFEHKHITWDVIIQVTLIVHNSVFSGHLTINTKHRQQLLAIGHFDPKPVYLYSLPNPCPNINVATDRSQSRPDCTNTKSRINPWSKKG